MSGWFSSAMEILKEKITTPLLLAAAFVLGGLLYTPDAVLGRLGLDAVRQSYRDKFGLALIIVAILLLARMFDLIGNWRAGRGGEAYRLDMMSRLTPHEKGFLHLYLQGYTSVAAPLHDGIAGGLVFATL